MYHLQRDANLQIFGKIKESLFKFHFECVSCSDFFSLKMKCYFFEGIKNESNSWIYLYSLHIDSCVNDGMVCKHISDLWYTNSLVLVPFDNRVFSCRKFSEWQLKTDKIFYLLIQIYSSGSIVIHFVIIRV